MPRILVVYANCISSRHPLLVKPRPPVAECGQRNCYRRIQRKLHAGVLFFAKRQFIAARAFAVTSNICATDEAYYSARSEACMHTRRKRIVRSLFPLFAWLALLSAATSAFSDEVLPTPAEPLIVPSDPTVVPSESALPTSPSEEWAPPDVESEEVETEEGWFEYFFPASRYKFEIGPVATNAMIADGHDIYGTDGAVLGFNIKFEECSSSQGYRFHSWSFYSEDRYYAGDIEIGAATFYGDYVKRLDVPKGELAIGGGFALGRINITNDFLNRDADYLGLGGSIAADGYYPVVCFAKSELGVIGSARLGALYGVKNDIFSGAATAIHDFGWGAEWRRSFGDLDNYWYVNFRRELLHWSELTLDRSGQNSFQMTGVNFGVVW